MSKESTIFYHEWLQLINSLSDINKLKLYDLIFSFDEKNLPKINDPHLKSVFDYISNKIAKNNSKYQVKCNKARDSANARWNRKEDANACERIKRKETHYDNGNDNVNVNDKEDKKTKAKKALAKMLADEEKELKERKKLTQTKFEEFWKAYDYKKDKGAAIKAFNNALKVDQADTIIAGAKQWVEHREGDPKYWKHPPAWLKQQCWHDEYKQVGNSNKEPTLAEMKKREEREKALITIDNQNPIFLQLKPKLKFMGKWENNLDFSYSTKDYAFFITGTKFNRDWIRKEYGNKIEKMLPDKKKFVIHSKEEFGFKT